MIVKTLHGRVKQLHGVQYILGLAHNFLSVSQLLIKGYSLFEKDNCVIRDNLMGCKLSQYHGLKATFSH